MSVNSVSVVLTFIKMVDLSLHRLCISYCVFDVMRFLVDIWVSRGRCLSWPSECSLTKDVIAGRIGITA